MPAVIRPIACSQCMVVKDRDMSGVKRVRANNGGRYICRNCKTANHTEQTAYPYLHSYRDAKRRCNVPKCNVYKHYGGRGIKFLWPSFEAFKEDMGSSWFEGATLDRIDNNGHYCKENCRWVTQAEQKRNTRRNVYDRESVREIRRLAKEGMKQADIAKQFGDTQGNISNIVTRRVWDID